MPVTVTEKHESRRVVNGPSPSVELQYVIIGTDDDVIARMTLESQTSLAWDLYGNGSVLLPLEEVSVQPVFINEADPDKCIWEGTARYGVIPYNESTFYFETSGGTEHITQSIKTVAKYAPEGKTAEDYKGAIGVTADGVEGVDIVVPVYQWHETHYLANALVTGAYKAAVHRLTGSVNSKPFRGFKEEEVLFIGATGTKRGRGDWEMTFRFAAKQNRRHVGGDPNEQGITIGDITGIEKNGWEYLWVSYEDAEDAAAKRLIKKPRSAYVEQVYYLEDFGLLGIGN